MNTPLHPRAAIDAKSTTYAWGDMFWFGSRDLGNTTGLTMGRMVMKPGASNERHHHPNCFLGSKNRVLLRFGERIPFTG